MKNTYCSSCQRVIGHKRALGWGTFFAVVLTGGIWLLTIPFYQKRCVICGNLSSGPPASEKGRAGAATPPSAPRYNPRVTLVVLGLLVLGIALIITLSLLQSPGSRTTLPAPRPAQSQAKDDPKEAAIAACRAALGPITIEATGGNVSAGELNVVARCSDGRRCLCWATKRGQRWTTEISR